MSRRVFGPMTLAAFVFLPAAPVLAEGLSIQPGQWSQEIMMTTTISANGESQTIPVKSSQESACIAEADAVVRASDFAPDTCEVEGLEESDRAMAFALACQQSGVTMQGTLKTTVSEDGTAVNAAMSLSGEGKNGVTMTSTAVTRHTRTGDCSSDKL